MYRILIISILVSVVELSPWFPSNECRQKKNQVDRILNTISQQIINVDDKINKFCVQQKNIAATETFGENSYKLEVYLPEFSGNFVVRIKHRLIYINGHDPKTNVCDLTHVDVRMLPDFVDPHGAIWRFRGGMLTVAFPYKYAITSPVRTYCSRDINPTLITVLNENRDDPLYH